MTEEETEGVRAALESSAMSAYAADPERHAVARADQREILRGGAI